VRRILLATTNPAKQAKLRWLLEGLDVEAVTPPSPLTVLEEGRTHLENAEAKARAWSRHFGMAAIASDGGLVIPALGERWDALLTARFAGPAAGDRERLDRLLEMMQPHEGADRSACWREALALAENGQVLASWSAQSQPGLLAESYEPSKLVPGFWAFTIWVLPHLGKTYGQLSPDEVERLEDHWGVLRQRVRGWFTEGPRPRRP